MSERISNLRSSQRLSDYTNLPVEILVVSLSVAPIFILVYFYPILPERIPVFLNLNGDVEQWAVKSLASVFRLPAMAIDLQLLCLLMKYATVQSGPAWIAKEMGEIWDHHKRITALSAGLWDMLRLFVVVKMSAESLSIFFASNDRFPNLKTLLWAIPWIVAVLAIVAALIYGYRLLVTKRRMNKTAAHSRVKQNIAKTHVFAGFIYYNSEDSAPFVDRYVFNFANKYVYALVACAVAYPLLVFWPV
jgi:uncharacterized membrane protein